MSRSTTTDRPVYHLNLATHKHDAKGVECRRCGAYVGLVQGKSGSWYTCQLVPKAGENLKGTLRAVPWAPHKCSTPTPRPTQEQADEYAQLWARLEEVTGADLGEVPNLLDGWTTEQDAVAAIERVRRSIERREEGQR